jgi:solute:Na+ symporter, SSS family
MFGLPVIDIIVIVVYFAVIIGIGIWSMRRIKNQEDFFLAGRRSGKILQTFAAFGQATSSENAVGVTTTTFTNGAGGVWSALVMLFATPMYWITSPWLRRMRVMTMGDFFEERYGSQRMAATYALIGCFCMMVNIALGLNAMTKTIVAITPKSDTEISIIERAEYNQAVKLEKLETVDYNSLTPEEQTTLKELQLKAPRKVFSHLNEIVVVWIVCFIIMIYTITGGLEAAFISDLIQGVFIILLSIILLPFAYAKINAIYGGSGVYNALQTIHKRLPESFFDIFGSPASIDFTWYYIAAVAIMSTITVVMTPNMIVVTGAAKDEYSARLGFTSGNFMKRFCTILWGLLGLAAIVLYSESVSNPDMVWGYATRDLLGSLKLGLVGLMIACLMAALMSTADCLMITASSLIIRNLYRPLYPNKDEKHYLLIGRIAGAAVVIGGAYVATQFESIFHMIKLAWEFNIIVAASFWIGIKWRRATKNAAWASIISALIIFSLGSIFTPVIFPNLRMNSYLLKMTNPKPLERTFTARELDVESKESEIKNWDVLNGEGKAIGNRPVPINLGEKFIRVDKLPQKAIFWTQGIRIDDNGNTYGKGMLNLELILVDKLGFDLSKNSYSLNETIRVIIRTVTPFIILFLVAFLTVPDDKKRLDQFFARMKTPVSANPEQDAKEMKLSFKNPQRFDHKKLFPNSNWEFYKWNKLDAVGFFIAVLVLLGMLAMLQILVSIGG